MFSLIPSVKAEPSPALAVAYSVSLDEHYSLFGNVIQRLNLQIQGNHLASTYPLSITAVFYYDFASVSGIGPDGNYSLTRGNSGTNTLQVTLPTSTTSFNITVSGTHSDFSVLYRGVATVPPVLVY